MYIPSEQLLPNKIIFVIGLHRSGTTLLENILSQSQDISSFENTGFPMDEGQYLQTVYPIGKVYGGPGKFGFEKKSHLTENSALCTLENRQKLLTEWGKFWDFDKTFLLEKSPPHILKTRFLNALFPESSFIILTRHPLAVALATQKWSKTSIQNLIKHWVVCHNILLNDLNAVPRKLFVSYENLSSQPAVELQRISEFTGLNLTDVSTKSIKDSNAKYSAIWNQNMQKFNNRVQFFWAKFRYEKIVNKFGYSLKHM